MEQLLRIQKRNNLNLVRVDGDIGPGGAHHDYVVCDIATEEPLLCIAFQRGPRLDPTSRHGVLDTDLLEVVRDRLIAFQKGEFSTRESAIALTHVEEALLWMAKRSDDRAERGVLGTTNK